MNRPRDTLVREEGEILWLAAGIPRRWLARGQKLELRDAPTYFGPVSYQIEASETGLKARVELPTRDAYRTAWLVLRAPGGKRIRAVEVDGKPWEDFDAATERIRLPLKAGPVEVSVCF